MLPIIFIIALILNPFGIDSGVVHTADLVPDDGLRASIHVKLGKDPAYEPTIDLQKLYLAVTQKLRWVRPKS